MQETGQETGQVSIKQTCAILTRVMIIIKKKLTMEFFMSYVYDLALFIFRRDLRLEDNTGLINALKLSKKVIPFFICDPEQITEKNKYLSQNALEFMQESLQDLAGQLKKDDAKLYIFHGHVLDVLKKLQKNSKNINFQAIFVNHDYTPYSTQRDNDIKLWCEKNDKEFIQSHDLLLHAPDAIRKKNNEPYTIFTPFYKRACMTPVRKPEKNRYKNFYTKKIPNTHEDFLDTFISKKNKLRTVIGGRTACLKILKNIHKHKDYIKYRDFPAHTPSTTQLSAHLKFGTCSVREIYYEIRETLGLHHPLLRQLYWRDFFTVITYYFPYVLGHAFHKKYDSIEWDNNKKNFTAWCDGQTGFPIVDAGMRELNTTGFMHNRVRMIVASFLTKDLHIDWRLGEKYFAKHLVDYDPAVNNGNWQWSASTGCDAQPYFRIFNPWLQQKKFDPDAEYIKRWVPELAKLTPKEIHTWFKPKSPLQKSYPRPITDHASASAWAKKLYRHAATQQK